MLDIKLIRENPEKINELLKRRNPELSIDEVLKIDIAIIDVTEETSEETKAKFALCKKLCQKIPGCRLLLLVSQESKFARQMAIDAIKSKVVNDFVLCDTSLDYLLAKLIAL